VVARERLPLQHVVVMTARDKRPVFAVPRDDVVYLGTTDAVRRRRAELASRRGRRLSARAANRVFAGPPLGARSRRLVVGAATAAASGGQSAVGISRRDEVVVDGGDLVSIARAITAYRMMAERVVDLVCGVSIAR
jgi:glycerol-3-phosphate dehydrogenase